jgi:hypothetical protein
VGTGAPAAWQEWRQGLLAEGLLQLLGQEGVEGRGWLMAMDRPDPAGHGNPTSHAVI